MILTIDSFSGPYRFLSNFSPHPFWIKDICFPTVEHWYQANKTCVGDTEMFMEIACAPTPGKAKRLGQKVKLRPDWEHRKVDVMVEGVTQKFKQNRGIAEILKITGDKILIEGNHWHDNIWGDCYCEKCKNIIGKNLLGNILMHVRDNL
jgi:ribA/ribD-fused uncharacterized protein